MASSLEVRVPFLDHRLVEMVWSIPQEWKILGGKTKILLRELLEQKVPKKYFDRPKKGFGIPIDQWLRGPLFEWAEDTINPATLNRHNILKSEPIGRCWKEHQSGEKDWGYWLWDVLMFQAWYESSKSHLK